MKGLPLSLPQRNHLNKWELMLEISDINIIKAARQTVQGICQKDTQYM